MKKYLLAAFAILVGWSAIAGAVLPSELKGVVLEETGNGKLRPIPFANVYWKGASEGTVTDSSGFFVLPDDHSNHHLVVSYVGYQPDTLIIESHADLTVILKKNIGIDEVRISHRRRSTEVSYMNPIYTQNINEDELMKAACCNLSESFETNPSIDVSFSDAVTGTRQIKLLGLSSVYTYISRENMPDLRGVSSAYGLTYTPGPWLESIQLSKGAGNVVNGFESIAGQINVELRKSNEYDFVYINLFGNQEGRSEANLVVSPWLGPHLSTDILLHGNITPWRMDGNRDGFMDFPTGTQINLMNRWKYDNHQGFETQVAVRYLKDDKLGGQMDYQPEVDKGTAQYWGMENATERFELWGKIGYVFPQHKYQSVGFQWKFLDYSLDGNFGPRNYASSEQSAYANLIYQNIILNTNHKVRTGASLYYDNISEQLEQTSQKIIEAVPGVFGEYTYTYLEKLSLVAGIRADFRDGNPFYTPRLHVRYAPTEKTVFRASAGSGQRRAWLIAENMGRLASSRQFLFGQQGNMLYSDLNTIEKAWNYGISATQHFKLNYRPAMLMVDFYRTEFVDRVVVDVDQSAQGVYFYNLTGKSYANSFQAQIDYELIRKFDIRLAYRWYDVQTQYAAGQMQQPLVARHRAFVNLAYATRANWKFDFTTQWQGVKRLPDMSQNPEGYRLAAYSPHIILMNAQVSKGWKNGLELYAGMENLTNYRQRDPIIAADDPFGDYFDASVIYGPVFGRMGYVGLRWKIGRNVEYHHEHHDHDEHSGIDDHDAHAEHENE